MVPTLQDRIAGGLLGLAAGDALGATLEFMTPAEIRIRHGVHRDIIGRGTFGWRPGQGTDDTDLTWAVLAAYVGHVDARETESINLVHRYPRGVTGAVAANMLAWWRSAPRDIGNTTALALATLARDGDPTRSGLSDPASAGNGSLMRCLPIALTGADLPERMVRSHFISAITHAERRCTEACWAYTEIAAALLDNALPSTAIAAALEAATDWHPAVSEALRTNSSVPAVELDTSGYVLASLSCAVWAIQQPDTLEDILIALVNRGDDADTTGAIAGGLLGIRDGLAAIPDRWIDRLEYRARLLAAVDLLLAMRTRRLFDGEGTPRGDTFGGDSALQHPSWLTPSSPSSSR